MSKPTFAEFAAEFLRETCKHNRCRWIFAAGAATGAFIIWWLRH